MKHCYKYDVSDHHRWIGRAAPAQVQQQAATSGGVRCREDCGTAAAHGDRSEAHSDRAGGDRAAIRVCVLCCFLQGGPSIPMSLWAQLRCRLHKRTAGVEHEMTISDSKDAPDPAHCCKTAGMCSRACPLCCATSPVPAAAASCTAPTPSQRARCTAPCCRRQFAGMSSAARGALDRSVPCQASVESLADVAEG